MKITEYKLNNTVSQKYVQWYGDKNQAKGNDIPNYVFYLCKELTM